MEEMIKDFSEDIFLKEKVDFGILNAMDDWVRVVDRDERTIFINKKMANEFAIDLKYSVELSNLGEEIIETLPESFSSFTFKTKKAQSKEILLNDRAMKVKSSPIFDRKNEVIGAVEVFSDIENELGIRRSLFKTHKKVAYDIALANKIQHTLLPKKRVINGSYFDYIYRPSEHLSGDIFDVFKIDDDKLGIYIADVVGHGISAAMLTVFVKISFLDIVEDYGTTSTKLVMGELKTRFQNLQLDDSIYLTGFFAIYSKKEKKLTYSNAGHNAPPIVKRSNKTEFLDITGLPISNILPDYEYKEAKVTLNSGDRLVLYTDGLVEFKNYENEEYGTHRIMESVEKKGNVIENIMLGTSDFSWNTISDDIAILVLKIGE